MNFKEKISSWVGFANITLKRNKFSMSFFLEICSLMLERCFYIDGLLWLHCYTERANGKVGLKCHAISQRPIRLVVLFFFHIVLSFMEMEFRMILAVFKAAMV